MAEILPPNPGWQKEYETREPFADKKLTPDGSLTTFDGTVISGPNADWAKEYEMREPFASKFVKADGSLTDELPTAGGSGAGQYKPIAKSPYETTFDQANRQIILKFATLTRKKFFLSIIADIVDNAVARKFNIENFIEVPTGENTYRTEVTQEKYLPQSGASVGIAVKYLDYDATNINDTIIKIEGISTDITAMTNIKCSVMEYFDSNFEVPQEGVVDHNLLEGKDRTDQHPIASITDLATRLTSIDSAVAEEAEDIDEIEQILPKKADLVNGQVPSTQLPSYVSDIIEVADFASLPAVGESAKLYLTLNDNRTWRWSGTQYAEVSNSLALGETEETAFRGDYGLGAYNHSQISSGNPHGTDKADVGLGNADNTSDADKPISTATQTALDGKTNTGHTHAKNEVGLANVDNTADNTKNVLSATKFTTARTINGVQFNGTANITIPNAVRAFIVSNGVPAMATLTTTFAELSLPNTNIQPPNNTDFTVGTGADANKIICQKAGFVRYSRESNNNSGTTRDMEFELRKNGATNSVGSLLQRQIKLFRAQASLTHIRYEFFVEVNAGDKLSVFGRTTNNNQAITYNNGTVVVEYM